ncbi:MAG: hypothetical protein ACK5O7_04565 [Holosporales bacterium]
MAEYRDQESIDKCALETQRWNAFSGRLGDMLNDVNQSYQSYKDSLNQAVPAHETMANDQREKTSGQRGFMSALSQLLNEETIGTLMETAENLLGDKKDSLIEKLQSKAETLPMGDKLSSAMEGLKGKGGEEGGSAHGGLLNSLEDKVEAKLNDSGIKEKAVHLLEEKGGEFLEKASDKLKDLPMGDKLSGLVSSKGGGLLKKATEKLSGTNLGKSGAGLLKKVSGGLRKKFKLPF